MKKLVLLSTLIAFALISCSETKKEDSKKEETPEVKDEKIEISEEGLNTKAAIDEYVFAQDTSFEFFSKRYTLPYADTKAEIEYQSVFYYETESDELKVIEENKSAKKFKDIARFYYKGDELQYVSKIHIDYEDDTKYTEKKYYYIGGELKFMDIVRQFDTPAEPASIEGESTDNSYAIDMFEQKGDFALSFAGFIEQPVGVFMVMNCALKGYNTVVRIDESGADTFIEELYNNQKENLGKPMIVKFEPVVDASNGLRQNVYRGAAWKN